MIHNRIYGLDLVRSIAILLVLFVHIGEVAPGFPSLLKKLSSTGWAGVDIFFVLSGYLIGGQVFRENLSLSISKKLHNFWIKRWFRTLPLYLTVLFVYAVIKPLAGWKFNDDIWKYFFFVQNYFSPQDFVQSWSLCIEEQFYIIFPLIAYFLPITLKKKWVWLIPLLISILSRFYIVTNYEVDNETQFSYMLRFPTYTHMDAMALGVFLAFTEKSWSSFVKKSALMIFLGSIFLFFLTLILVGKTPTGVGAIFCFTLLGVFSAAMVSSSKFIPIPKRLEFPVYWIATLSYGIYLWNNLLLRVIDRYFQNIHWLGTSLFFISTTVFISWVSYQIIEKPFIKLRYRFLRPM